LSVVKSLNVTLSTLKINCLRNNYGILLVEVLGISLIQNITTNRISIYNRQKRVLFRHGYLTIEHFKQTSDCSMGNYAVYIVLGNHGTNVKIEITDTLFRTRMPLYVNSSTSNGVNFIYISKVNFTMQQSNVGKKAISINVLNKGKKSYQMSCMIQFTHCYFSKIDYTEHLIFIVTTQKDYGYFKMKISNCSFHHNYYGNVLTAVAATTSLMKSKVFITIANTTIFGVKCDKHVIYVENAHLLLQRTTFDGINSNRTLVEAPYSVVTFDQHVRFLLNRAVWCLIVNHIAITEHTIVNFASNYVTAMFTRPSAVRLFTLYEQSVQTQFQCLFQYVSMNGGDLDERFHQGEVLNYSIMFESNKGYKLATSRFALAHCGWILSRGFKTTNSQLVNQKFIRYKNNRFTGKNDTTLNTLCLCEGTI